MKKLLAILLVLALLLPMGTVAHAEEAEKDPFYLMQWNDDDSDLTNVYPMPFFWLREQDVGKENAIPFGGANTYVEVAENLLEYFKDYPDGTRFINFAMLQNLMRKEGYYEDVIYFDKAVEATKEWLNGFLPVYKSMGGKLDGLIFDLGMYDISANNIQAYEYSHNKNIYREIAENPLYETDIRPRLVERGFKFYDKITEETPELFCLHSSTGDEYAKSRAIWNTVVRSYVNQKVTETCEPLWKYYPDAESTDYCSSASKTWLKSYGGHASGSSGGNYITAGTSSNENFYSNRPASTFFADKNGPVYNTISGYNSAVYEDTTFNYFLCDANLFKNVYLGAEDNQVTWWPREYFYNKEDANATSFTPYYSETLLHMGMLDPQYFLGFVIRREVNHEVSYDFCLQIIDDVLDELNRMVGYADRKPIHVVPAWNYRFVLSGTYANGRNVWRLTPDIAEISLEEFKVEGAADPTFSVNGTTVTFPQGKIVADSKIRGCVNYDAENLTWDTIENNSCGYWIETPKDVMPIITRAENYHSEYPAYGEDYEDYKLGTEYNYKNALPVGAWEVAKKGSSSAVVQANPADANDQVLALTGNYTLKNVKLPKNITAGDSYAEHQAWEVSVTLPSDMAEDAEVVLLNVINDKKKSKDGGFKLAGGKVYYAKGEEYAELEGVTLTAGTEYTLKRELDFTNAEALTSDYYVLDASGNVLGSIKDVPMAQIEIPVFAISIACTNVTGSAVLLDDYKLYPTEVATDFEVYGARLGMKITETDKAQSEDVAYRLSWMNATQKEKTYSVVAAYYNGETLASEEVIKEVKLAPNMEGVETGIVELGEKGKAVRVYLRDDNPAEEEGTGTGDPSAPSEDPGEGLDMMTIILIAAAAVVLIAVIVVVIVVSSKKKAKAAKAPEAEEVPENDAE